MVDVITAGGFVVAAVAAMMACIQLRESKNIARSQFIFAVDQSLAPFETIRHEVAENDKPSSEIELRRYIAALERVGVLLRDRYIDIDTVERLYGSRLEKLINNKNGTYVRIPVSKPDKWQDFLWLWRTMETRLKLLSSPAVRSVE